MLRLRIFLSFLILSGVFGEHALIRADDSSIRPLDLTVEMLSNPIGIDMNNPRLSWKNASDKTGYGFEQTAYRIEVASNIGLLNNGTPDLWDSGWVESFESVQIPYEGRELSSDMKVFWKVQVNRIDLMKLR